jgi:hypothetical protein
MDRNRDHEIDLADDALDEIDVRADYLPGDEVVRAVERGELTSAEASEELQAAARRHAAEHGPDLDTDEDGRVSEAGFGAGRGMAKHSSGGRKAREGVEGN